MQKNAAYERYETALQEIELDESQAQRKADEQITLEQEIALHKASCPIRIVTRNTIFTIYQTLVLYAMICSQVIYVRILGESVGIELVSVISVGIWGGNVGGWLLLESCVSV